MLTYIKDIEWPIVKVFVFLVDLVELTDCMLYRIHSRFHFTFEISSDDERNHNLLSDTRRKAWAMF